MVSAPWMLTCLQSSAFDYFLYPRYFFFFYFFYFFYFFDYDYF